MEESFYYGLLRISIIQILKANGFDKIKPSTLNVISDIYVKMFTKLITNTLRASQLRHDNPSTIDVLQGMIDSNLIKLDDNDIYNTKSVESFKHWLIDSIPNTTITRLNQVPANFKKIIVENRKFDQNIDEQDEKLKKLKQKQDFYNNFNNDNNSQLHKQMNLEDEEDLDFNLHWLDYLIEKDYKYNRKKYDNTIFSSDAIGGDYLIDESVMNEYLPINVRHSVEDE